MSSKRAEEVCWQEVGADTACMLLAPRAILLGADPPRTVRVPPHLQRGLGGGAKTQSQIEDRDSVSFRDSVSLRRGAENV